MWSENLRSIDFNYTIRLEIGLESDMVLRVCVIEDETAVVVVASYRSVSRNPFVSRHWQATKSKPSLPYSSFVRTKTLHPL